jgi:peptide/nickel transport system ATP-binding protein/oligopeptide transport system ATP-binding protein
MLQTPARQHPLLSVRRLVTSVATPTGAKVVVDHISFDLDRGETLCIAGESGSGKSMTALSLMRLLPEPMARITSGEALFKGRDLFALSEADMRSVRGNDIGMIFQEPMTSLNPVLSVGQQLTEAVTAHKSLPLGAAQAEAKRLLDIVQIPEAARRLKQYPFELSGGMRQRVMIAIALACDPDVLIADEPTTALDVTIQAQILELVKDLRRKLGMAIIWITHDLGVIAGIADRVMVMYGGQIVEHAPVRELFANPQHPYTRALLQTIPRITGERETRLKVIEGQPPILTGPLTACPFRARCEYRHDTCDNLNPQRRPVDGQRPGPRCRLPLARSGPAGARPCLTQAPPRWSRSRT